MMKLKRLLALDIGSQCIKAVEFQAAGGRVVVTGFGIKGFSAEGERNAATAEVINVNRFRGLPTASAISGRNVITRYISMRRLEDQELHNAIRFEADKYIPFGIDEVVLDCQKIEDLEGDQMRVLLVAVKRNVVEDHLRTLRELGLESRIIDVEAFAISNAFIDAMGDKIKTVTVAVLDIGHLKTNIIVVSNGKAIFNREVYIGCRDILEPVGRRVGRADDQLQQFVSNPGDEVAVLVEAMSGPLDDLCNEITLSFEFFENEYERKVESVWLSGGGSYLFEIQNEIAKRLAKPTSLWDPMESVTNKLDGIRSQATKDIARKLAVAIGLGTRVRRGE